VSFGDSECERNALLTVGRLCPCSRAKSIKFVERPTVEQLRRQLDMIFNNFSFIVQHDGLFFLRSRLGWTIVSVIGNLDLMLTISSTSTTPPPQYGSNEMVPLPNVLPPSMCVGAPPPTAGLGNGLGKI